MVQAAVSIRPIRPSDASALERFYAALSDESRQTRFFAVTRGLTARQSAAFCAADHAHREGFVATDTRSGRLDDIVGHLCLEPDEDGTAEMAVAVADELQGEGIARRLLDAGIVWARAMGIDRLTATMLATNAPIYRLVSGLGLAVACRAVEPDVLGVTVDLRRAAPSAPQQRAA